MNKATRKLAAFLRKNPGNYLNMYDMHTCAIGFAFEKGVLKDIAPTVDAAYRNDISANEAAFLVQKEFGYEVADALGFAHSSQHCYFKNPSEVSTRTVENKLRRL